MATRIVTVRSHHEMIRVDGQRVNPCVISTTQDRSKLQTPAVPVSRKVPPNDLPDIQHPNACSRKVPRTRSQLPSLVFVQAAVRQRAPVSLESLLLLGDLLVAEELLAEPARGARATAGAQGIRG
jgi:hypothetical protein